jgi:hypothetical protein
VRSVWVARTGGALQLLALEGESLAGMPTEQLDSTFSSQAHSVDGALSALIASSTTTLSILVGAPRESQPYASIDDAGTSQLAVVAQEAERPPGFPATWFFEAGRLGPPLIGGTGFVAFSARVADALNPAATRTIGIWRDTPEGELELLAAEGLPLQIGAEEKTLAQIATLPECSSQSGLPTRISESGELLFVGATSTGVGGAIVWAPEPDGTGAVALVAVAILGGRRARAGS